MSKAMPMPFTYRSATEDYEKFLHDLLSISMLQTWNQCYTMTRSVFHVFRSHVEPQVAMDFAQALPAVLRAIFVEDWDLSAKVTPFPSAAALTAEVKAIRADHNLSTDIAIVEVALALRHALKKEDYELMLKKLPPDAAIFWRTV
jgi:uncharacterized protein (DUF2267 family)